jgi:hypothetical protein
LAAFVDDFAEAFAIVEAEDNFVAGFDAGAGFESGAVEFDPFAVDEVLAFAPCQFKMAVRFQREWRGFAGDELACDAGFGASVLAGQGVSGGSLGTGYSGARKEKEGCGEYSRGEACGLGRAHTEERADCAPELGRGVALNL